MADIACRTYGVVTQTPPWPNAPTTWVSKNGSRVRYETALHVARDASVVALFARQAICTLGDARPTEIITRFGGRNPQTGAPSLFWQGSGKATCSLAKGVDSETKLFCDSSGCPAIVYADGSEMPTRSGRRISRVRSPIQRARAAEDGTTTTTRTQRVEIEFCAGAFRIEVARAYGGGYTEGEVDDGEGDRSHIRATLVETIVESHTHTETTTGTSPTITDESSFSSSISLSTVQVSGDGACDARFPR